MNPILRTLTRCFGLAALGMLAGCGSKQEELPKGHNSDLPDELQDGNWNEARDAAPLTPEQQAEADELAGIGYADAVNDAPEIVKVTRYAPEQSFAGVNFYVSGQAPEAFLIDMDGEVLHRWSYDYNKLWPGIQVKKDASGRGKWRRAHLYPNGDILAIHEGIGMIRLDKESKLLWEYPGRTHHDMHVTPDGHIWALAREVSVHEVFSKDKVSIDDLVVELDADGKELRKISILGCLQRSSSELLKRIRYPDMFHANSIEVLDGSIASKAPAFAAGNLLISLRHLDAVVVIDPSSQKIVWSLVGEFRWQHDAQITPDGTLLLFDNHRLPEAAPISKILEFDPATKKLLWSFAGRAQEPFYSKTCGTTQRLGNGNTLIAESDGGRAIEVTPKGEVVWEYYNPHRGGPGNKFIACLFALHRVGQRADFDWLSADDDSEE